MESAKMVSIILLILLSNMGFAQNDYANPNSMGVKEFYVGNDGGAYYVAENNGMIFWAAEHPGKNYAHVFKGKKEGRIIQGKWWSVPKYGAKSKGTVKLKVSQGSDHLSVVSQTGGFPAKKLSVNRLGKRILNVLPLQRQKPQYSASNNNDLDGAFRFVPENIVLYTRQEGSSVAMFGESKFRKGQKPSSAFVFVGTRLGKNIKGNIAYLSKGKAKGYAQRNVVVSAHGLFRLLGGKDSRG